MTKWRLKAVHETLQHFVNRGEGDPGRALVYLDDHFKELESKLRTLDVVKKLLNGMVEELEDAK